MDDNENFICPECGYTSEEAGRCPNCDIAMIPIDQVGEERKAEEDLASEEE